MELMSTIRGWGSLQTKTLHMLLIEMGKKMLLLKPNSCICNQWRLIHDSVRHAKTGKLQMNLSWVAANQICHYNWFSLCHILNKSWNNCAHNFHNLWKVFCTRCVQPGSLAVHVLILRHMVTRWQSSSKKNAFPCRDTDLVLAVCSSCFELKTMLKYPNSTQHYQNIHWKSSVCIFRSAAANRKTNSAQHVDDM